MQTNRQKIWAIAGKGGVGKSYLAASLGTTLARMGKSVIAVDADMTEPNLQAYLGVEGPAPTLQDLLENKVRDAEVLIQTSEPGLRVIAGASSILGIANQQFSQRERVVRFIAGLNAEVILVDLSGRTTPNVLDFFNMSDEAILAVTPDPTAMHEAYAFVRSAVCRNIQRKFSSIDTVQEALKLFVESAETSKPRTMMDFYDQLCSTDLAVAEKIAALVDNYRPHILVNMAGSDQDRRVAEIIQSAAKKFLNVDLRFCGLVISDSAAGSTGQAGATGLKESTAAQQIRQSVLRILNYAAIEAQPQTAAPEKTHSATPIMGLNTNLYVAGSELHVQTEDMGQAGKCVITQVFCDGKIIRSVKSEYPAATGDSGQGQVVTALMRRQHFDIIRDIEGGKVSAPRPA